MIWLTWRQFRAQAMVAAVSLAAFASLLAGTRIHLARLFAASGLSDCHGAACGELANDFLAGPAARYVLLYLLGLWTILLTPAVIGIFWGAPLIARERETGTFQLAWTQSVSRTKWLAVKLCLINLVAMGVTEAASLIYGWWAAPIVDAARLDPPPTPVPFGMNPVAFEVRGITPLGLAALSFTIGVTLGLLLQRSVPAMAVTLGVFIAIQIAAPHLVPPDHLVTPVTAAAKPNILARPGSAGAPVVVGIVARAVPGRTGAWIVSSGAVDRYGKSTNSLPNVCAPSAGSSAMGPPQLGRCLTDHGISLRISYVPANRFWSLQWIETSIFAGMALALAGFCFWRFQEL